MSILRERRVAMNFREIRYGKCKRIDALSSSNLQDPVKHKYRKVSFVNQATERELSIHSAFPPLPRAITFLMPSVPSMLLIPSIDDMSGHAIFCRVGELVGNCTKS